MSFLESLFFRKLRSYFIEKNAVTSRSISGRLCPNFFNNSSHTILAWSCIGLSFGLCCNLQIDEIFIPFSDFFFSFLFVNTREIWYSITFSQQKITSKMILQHPMWGKIRETEIVAWVQNVDKLRSRMFYCEIDFRFLKIVFLW